jgi:hypothetical protein
MNKAPKQPGNGRLSRSLEQLWDELLSRQPETIKSAFSTLDPGDQQAVLVHLKRMASEGGWQTEQRTSARIAMQVLEDQSRQE